MSLTQSAVPDRRPSPGLSLNLSSNNPFRRLSPAIPSPSLPSPQSAPDVPVKSARPVSRNPFLSDFERELALQAQETDPGTQRNSDMDGMDAKELFNRLTLRDDDLPLGSPLERAQSRPEPSLSHRPSRSDEEWRRPPPTARPPQKKKPTEELDIFASPEKKSDSGQRRNSESSVADRPPLSEEDRRRRERRRREHEARRREGGDKREGSSLSRDGKERSRPKSSRNRKPHGLDVIDKLDVTGIYGGGLFHHDGPFDACNPHRNRKRDHRAPMQAFPAGSANMAMGGSGPVNNDLDLARVHGIGAEGYRDYGSGYNSFAKQPRTQRATSFDPYSRVEPVHGEESVGLGTSTFLDGAPASRKAIERRESESEQQVSVNGALSRKKSLARRFRGISQPRPRLPDGSIRSPDARYNGPMSPQSPRQPLMGGKIPSTNTNQPQSPDSPAKTYQNEPNPFDNLYDEEYDKKGATIKAAEADKVMEKDGAKDDDSSTDRPQASPRRAAPTLDRRPTADNSPEQQPKAGGSAATGFLSRVKSFKGGRRPRRPS